MGRAFVAALRWRAIGALEDIKSTLGIISVSCPNVYSDFLFVEGDHGKTTAFSAG